MFKTLSYRIVVCTMFAGLAACTSTNPNGMEGQTTGMMEASSSSISSEMSSGSGNTVSSSASSGSVIDLDFSAGAEVDAE